jgi:hypothetical protein
MIPAVPLFANGQWWAKAANNLLDRAEGLLRDELAWRRAHACLMKEYYRLALIEGQAALRPLRRALYRKWHWRCEAEHKESKQLCPFAADGTPEPQGDPTA